MSDDYLSDREKGPKPRTGEEIGGSVRTALRHLIQSRVDDGAFGYKFPEVCPDTSSPCGCSSAAFHANVRGEIPDLPEEWQYTDAPPDSLAIVDLLRFCARSVGKPIHGGYHDFFKHYHLTFDRDEGLKEFVADVNRLLARNGVALALTPEGQAVRLGPPVLRHALASALFRTGDAITDSLLEDARRLILSPDLGDRRNALEKLWGAFERIKTLEPGKDKKAQATALLDRAVRAPRLRAYIETEAKELTEIGNTLQIRHFETTQEKLERPEDVDYLFHRMFSFIRLVLRATGREA
jgi:hypothetical protein